MKILNTLNQATNTPFFSFEILRPFGKPSLKEPEWKGSSPLMDFKPPFCGCDLPSGRIYLQSIPTGF